MRGGTLQLGPQPRNATQRNATPRSRHRDPGSPHPIPSHPIPVPDAAVRLSSAVGAAEEALPVQPAHGRRPRHAVIQRHSQCHHHSGHQGPARRRRRHDTRRPRRHVTRTGDHVAAGSCDEGSHVVLRRCFRTGAAACSSAAAIGGRSAVGPLPCRPNSAAPSPQRCVPSAMLAAHAAPTERPAAVGAAHGTVWAQRSVHGARGSPGRAEAWAGPAPGCGGTGPGTAGLCPRTDVGLG